MVVAKESKKEFDNLFEDEKANLDFEEKYITPTFSKQFSIGRRKVYMNRQENTAIFSRCEVHKKGESLFYEIFNNKELKNFVGKFNIKKFPMRICDNGLFLNLFYFIGEQ